MVFPQPALGLEVGGEIRVKSQRDISRIHRDGAGAGAVHADADDLIRGEIGIRRFRLGEGLAAEWGRKGVRVNTVSPGFTQTPALERGVAVGNLDATHMIASKALGRLVRPEEIAAAVAFLASDQASAITGVNLPVDAGFLVATPWMGFGGLRE